MQLVFLLDFVSFCDWKILRNFIVVKFSVFKVYGQNQVNKK